ncbi:uncharacterized protein [Mytilus edulis]|uniref:uncharacterized protein n=1 Tax=Mytilus edulis TaxID=6550 RepID=UPI0039EED5B1
MLKDLNSGMTTRASKKSAKKNLRKQRSIISTTPFTKVYKKTKPFWRYVKSRRHENIGILAMKQNGALVNDNKEKANILLNQFESVFTKDTLNATPNIDKKVGKSIPPLKITTDGVEKLLRNIKLFKAIGPDNLPNIVLKNCSKQLAPGLRHIFQQSINSGTLPTN